MKTLKTNISLNLTPEKQAQVLSEINSDIRKGRIVMTLGLLLMTFALSGIGSAFILGIFSVIFIMAGFVILVGADNEDNYRPTHNFYGVNDKFFK